MRKTSTAIVGTSVALAIALTGCSSKAESSGGGSSGSGASGEVKTDYGVTAKDITLGVFTDTSGVFKILGLGITQGNQMWADDVNANGGICGRQIKLDIKDHGYAADKAVPLYSELKGNILGMVQLLGSPILAALKQQITADKVASVPASWASTNLDSPSVVMVGPTYDVEMINGMSYLQSKKLIADGDKIGHIYIDSEYGQNGALGSKYYASKHNQSIVEVKIGPTDTDLTSAITDLKSQGVKGILLTTTPAQTASAVGQAAAQGLDVPIFGSNPTFAPQLLETPAAPALESGKFITVAASVPFSADVPKAKEIAKKYKAKYKDAPTIGPDVGYAFGEVWGGILKTACDKKDLTRQGILDAISETTVDTEGLTGKLDFTKPGQPSSREAYMLVPDKASEGGLKTDTPDLYTSKEAADYKTPFQK